MSNAPEPAQRELAGDNEPAEGQATDPERTDDAGPSEQGSGRPGPAFVPIAGGLAALLLRVLSRAGR
ncbi:MAG: hypothetical protein ACRDJH_13380 [Thermomicrobiales bacterium]